MDTLPTDKLVTMKAGYNPRVMPAHEMEALRLSLRSYGMVEPVVVNKRSMTVVGGHQRIDAALAEGITDMPVFWVDLEPIAEKQLNLALNRINGEWDSVKLAQLVLDLRTQGEDFSVTGFTQDEIGRLLGQHLDEEATRLGGSGEVSSTDVPEQTPMSDAERGLRYEVVFDSIEDRRWFFDFLRWLARNRFDPTPASRLMSFIDESIPR